MRFAPQFIHFKDAYRRLTADEFDEMFAPRRAREIEVGNEEHDIAWQMYRRKFSAEYAKEMRRSVKVMLDFWVSK
jgi:hypothetical protein